ncbi:MAG TPA: glycosyltransferase [Pyrinomonadaceae bacterium]|jgi:predicted glycosyltransferase|nr:glycosyltransferase [Pyrinomonadaceae bacterium]
MRKPLRIVNYAINGVGAGHVTRLIAISRWLRRHAKRLEVEAEIYFLTSSEAGALLFAERFPAFKLPSRTVVAEAGIDETRFLAMARPWVCETLRTLEPDLLLVDTFPQGYFEELSPFLIGCPKTAFIYRPLKEIHAGLPEFQNALSHYNLILVPEYEQNEPVLVPPAVRDRVRYIGPMMVRERVEILSREEARKVLGIANDLLAVYISAGGGGDPNAEPLIQTAYKALSGIPGLHLVIGAGPLYRGSCFYGDHLTWLAQGNAAEFMAAFDIAVSAAGYNSFNELMHFGVPAVFLPQEKWADDQNTRAERAVSAGAAVVLDSWANGQALRQIIERFRDPAERVAAARSARNLVPRNHASEAATALLNLLIPGEQTASDGSSEETVAS